MREDKSLAAEILKTRGLRLSDLRTQLAEPAKGEVRAVVTESSSLIEFVDSSGQSFATTHGRPLNVPRIGERVLLGEDDKRKLYSVREITYEYQQISVILRKPAHLLERILIVVAEESDATQTGAGE